MERLQTHTAGLEAQLAIVLEKREGEAGCRKERDRLQQEVRIEGRMGDEGGEKGREDEEAWAPVDVSFTYLTCLIPPSLPPSLPFSPSLSLPPSLLPSLSS